jgi:hypothetical protein
VSDTAFWLSVVVVAAVLVILTGKVLGGTHVKVGPTPIRLWDGTILWYPTEQGWRCDACERTFRKSHRRA